MLRAARQAGGASLASAPCSVDYRLAFGISVIVRQSMGAVGSQAKRRKRRQDWQRASAVLAILWAPASVVHAQGSATERSRDSATVGGSASVAVRDIRPGLGDLEHFGRSIAHVVTAPGRWNTGDWMAVPLAGGALVVLSALDAEGRDFMRRQRDPDLTRFGNELERLGTVSNYGILLAFYAAGLVLDDTRARTVAVEAVASSLIAAGVITPTLQFITGRSRPRSGNEPHTWDAFSRNISFPSGHTTHAFSVASVIATEYEQIWVKAVAYGLASLVGLCRMHDDAHYLTDVTAAALIGTAVGRSVAHFGQRQRGNLSVQPVTTPGGPGIGLSLSF